LGRSGNRFDGMGGMTPPVPDQEFAPIVVGIGLDRQIACDRGRSRTRCRGEWRRRRRGEPGAAIADGAGRLRAATGARNELRPSVLKRNRLTLPASRSASSARLRAAAFLDHGRILLASCPSARRCG
jgi:hypothetical protein